MQENKSIITAKMQVQNIHPDWNYNLPEVAVLFFMSKGIDFLVQLVNSHQLPLNFPCMLEDKPVFVSDDNRFCFLYGGAGAPQAADTIETLNILGVKTIITVGMFGTFSSLVTPGEIICPNRAFIEEGTSRHYIDYLKTSSPDVGLHSLALENFQFKSCPIISTDAVYRETYEKEELWREEGAVGSDMETSAVFTVSKFLGMQSLAILIASDCHPRESSSIWKWMMTDQMKQDLVKVSLDLTHVILNNTR